jgi:hypothetical protein
MLLSFVDHVHSNILHCIATLNDELFNFTLCFQETPSLAIDDCLPFSHLLWYLPWPQPLASACVVVLTKYL